MRRAGQSPYLSTATAHQSTSSVSLQDYARSALSLPESQPVASTSAAASSSNPQGAAPKKKKKKRKKPRSEVDPDIQSAVANVGLPLGRSERSNRGEQPRTRESGASTAGQSQSGPQVQDTGRDLVQFRQRHDVWAGALP